MRRISAKWLAPWVTACVLIAPLAMGSTALPFTDGFEAGALDVNNWSSNATGTIDFPSDAPNGAGTKSCKIDFEELTLNVDEGQYYNVWAQVYAKAAAFGAGEEPEASQLEGCTAAFYVGADSNVYAWTTGGFTAVTNLSALADLSPTAKRTDWIGFLVHLDYGNETYDLYVKENGYASGDTLTRVASAFAFYASTPPTHLSNFVIETELETRVDAVALNRGAGAAGNPLMGQVETDSESRQTNVWKAVAISDPGNLGGSLGEALLANTDEYDQMEVWYTNSGWSVFQHTNSAIAEGWSSMSGLQANQIELSPGGVAYVKHFDDPAPPFHVYALGYTPEAGGTVPKAPASGYELYGTDSDVNGWNTLVWGGGSKTLDATADDGGSANLGDPEVGPSGARVYARSPNSRVYDFRYRYNSDWMRSGNPLSLDLQDGQIIWVYHTNGTMVTWNPNP